MAKEWSSLNSVPAASIPSPARLIVWEEAGEGWDEKWAVVLMSLPGMEGTSDLSWTDSLGLLWWPSDLKKKKNPPANAGDSILVFLPGKSHGQRNLVVYSPRGQKKKI